jgi:nucleotide-binding universal stress UspA family protein
MPGMKSIVVHIDASPRSAERLGYALRLARRHGAELTALYGVIPSMMVSPGFTAEGVAAVASLMADLDRSQRQQARETFERVASQGPVKWAEAQGEILLASLRRHALLSDLLVLGQHDRQDNRTGALPADLAPSLIIESGRPALVVPYAGTFVEDANCVLLAWKGSRESARAATAALPWLRLARRIVVAHQPQDEQDDDYPALVHWMRLHGVNGPVEQQRLVGVDVGNGLLSLANDLSAGLLVMGCYGHSRMREWAFGGATRTVLESMTLPVLMGH